MRKIWNSNIFKVILILVIIFLILIDYWGLSLFGEVIDYTKMGTVGEWFSNMATVITIVIAAITIRNDKLNAERERTFTLELRNEEQQKKDFEQQKQDELLAQSVYTWISGTQDPVTKKVKNFKLFLCNKTGIPIFEWKIYDSTKNVIADSIIYGPIFPESQKIIDAKGVERNTNISIIYKSYLGKYYYRSGADIEEVTSVG